MIEQPYAQVVRVLLSEEKQQNSSFEMSVSRNISFRCWELPGGKVTTQSIIFLITNLTPSTHYPSSSQFKVLLKIV